MPKCKLQQKLIGFLTLCNSVLSSPVFQMYNFSQNGPRKSVSFDRESSKSMTTPISMWTHLKFEEIKNQHKTSKVGKKMFHNVKK